MDVSRKNGQSHLERETTMGRGDKHKEFQQSHPEKKERKINLLKKKNSGCDKNISTDLTLSMIYFHSDKILNEKPYFGEMHKH